MSILREWERRMEATERLERWRVVRDCPHGPLTRRESVVLRLIVFVLAALALMFASRASASDSWSGSLQWRGERIELQSRCGPMDTAAVLKELEAGLARVQADVPGVTIPPLGAPWSPYIVLWTDAPKCPGNAIGCTGDAPFLKLPWTMARLDCRRGGLAALDHEAMEHTACRRLRPIHRPGNPRLDVKRCTRAGHKLCAGKRCNVLGERTR